MNADARFRVSWRGELAERVLGNGTLGTKFDQHLRHGGSRPQG